MNSTAQHSHIVIAAEPRPIPADVHKSKAGIRFGAAAPPTKAIIDAHREERQFTAAADGGQRRLLLPNRGEPADRRSVC